PGVLAIVIILLFLRERRAASRSPESRVQSPESLSPVVDSGPWTLDSGLREGPVATPRSSVPASALGTRFWMFAAISTVFALGNSSDAFIFLRTASLESSVAAVPLIYFAYNLV